MNRGNEFRKRLAEGRAIGGHVFLNDPAITEALARHGYDFIWIDAEHGPFDKQNLLMHIKAAKKAKKPVGVSIGPDPKMIETYKSLGVDFFSCGDDISFLQMGAERTISMLHK
ncbi:hypothetical protein [Sphaerochaeta halotolerans]|jgi:2-dehydro-3-deoxyglucarate aldolase/4-hydroxy-2-oxoheptanedioate aldolase|uniref:hypothetical protein n=1 Tax=Sphaerochaeta halotolerans TaxID=2293840 RepID=UPI0013685094|nr:hypothetical protein [Sphaerochaeta halotolerans]MXI86031.1 hypothetical protein [Sphaerochaeta halotolerans]